MQVALAAVVDVTVWQIEANRALYEVLHYLGKSFTFHESQGRSTQVSLMTQTTRFMFYKGWPIRVDMQIWPKVKG